MKLEAATSLIRAVAIFGAFNVRNGHAAFAYVVGRGAFLMLRRTPLAHDNHEDESNQQRAEDSKEPAVAPEAVYPGHSSHWATVAVKP